MHNASKWQKIPGKWSAALACLLLFVVAGCGGGSGSGATNWQYAPLGDSLAAGLIANQGYVSRYQGYIQTDTAHEVSINCAGGQTCSATNLATPGWTSSDLLNALQNDSTYRAGISNAQVVTFDIGGNDLLHVLTPFTSGTCGGSDNQQCLRDAVTGFNANWDAIVRQVLTLRDKNATIIRTMNVYNPFVAQEQAAGTFTILKPYLEQVNAHIAASASANGIPMADVYHAFNGPNGDQDAASQGLLSTVDNLHPNDNGHKLIADTFRTLGYAPLK